MLTTQENPKLYLFHVSDPVTLKPMMWCSETGPVEYAEGVDREWAWEVYRAALEKREPYRGLSLRERVGIARQQLQNIMDCPRGGLRCGACINSVDAAMTALEV